MKVGDLVLQDGYTTRPGVVIKIVESNVFGGDMIVKVIWSGHSKPLNCLMSSLKECIDK